MLRATAFNHANESGKAKKPMFFVVVCTYDTRRISDLDDCVRSLLSESYKDLEVIVVVDHNKELFDILSRKYSDMQSVRVILNDSSQKGQAACMNYGVLQSRGEIVCFIDDDAIADENWLLELLRVYNDKEVYGVGGNILPLWLCEKPDFLPEEAFWLIGSTMSLYPQELIEVRNVWSSNVSFSREVFKRVGMFSPFFGEKGSRLFQAEDADFGVRCSTILGKGILFNPSAIVHHKIYPDRVRMRNLMVRAFEQGVAKSLIFRLYGDSSKLSTESDYLKSLLFRTIPKYVKQVFWGSSRVRAVKKLLFIITIMTMVFIGFLSGLHVKGIERT